MTLEIANTPIEKLIPAARFTSLFNFFWFFSNFKRTIEFHPNSLNPLPHFGKVYPLTFKVFI